MLLGFLSVFFSPPFLKSIFFLPNLNFQNKFTKFPKTGQIIWTLYGFDFFFSCLVGLFVFYQRYKLARVLKTAKIQSTVQVALFWYLFISSCTRTMRASHLQNHASVHSGGSFWRLHVLDYVYNSENLNKYVFPHLPNLINMNYCPFLKNPQKWIYQVPSSTSHADQYTEAERRNSF